MNYVTVGTLGHVDHGKTALVKALTGVNTDRLREEQERGISIVLGYSHLDLPHGELGIVDVPGHEKFIRTMISGATAIEAILLVVDINEGVKPQTIEHLDIATLLGVQRGVIVVTKCDTAEPDMRDLVVEDINDLTAKSFLKDAPIVFTSSKTGQGLDELKEALDAIVAHSTGLKDEGYAYLPVDRVFTMAGFGTVVTGTLRRGGLRVDDEVEIYPQGQRAKVRELQSHNAFTEACGPGFRTAVNLRGVEKASINRGDIVASPGSLEATNIIDVSLSLLDHAGKEIKQNQILRLLFGTRETYGRVHFLDRNELAPGDSCVAQFSCEERFAVLNDEPYVVRTYSPMHTVGGGRILGASDKRYRRQNKRPIERLTILRDGTLNEKVNAKLLDAREQGQSITRLAMDLRADRTEIDACLKEVSAVVIGDQRAIHSEIYAERAKGVTQALKEFHKKEPTLQGLTRSQLLARLNAQKSPPSKGVTRSDGGCYQPLDQEFLEAILHALLQGNTVLIKEGIIRLASFDSARALSTTEKQLAKEIEDAFKEAFLQPPNLDDILQNDSARKRMHKYLLDQKILVLIGGGARKTAANSLMCFHKEAIAEAQRRLLQDFAAAKRFTVPEAKETLNLSRKYIIPLLEHLDALGFTKRAEDFRIIK